MARSACQMPPRGAAAGARRGHSHERGSIGGLDSETCFDGVGRVASMRAAAEVGLKLVRMAGGVEFGRDGEMAARGRAVSPSRAAGLGLRDPGVPGVAALGFLARSEEAGVIDGRTEINVQG